MVSEPVDYMVASSVAKMIDPEMPVTLKKVKGPSTYSAANGFMVSIDELVDAPLFKVLGPMVGNDGSLIVATSVKRYSNNVLLIKFGKLTANTATGAITVEALDDGSTALDGVDIYVLAFGGITSGSPVLQGGT